jgi:hypothetical protein
MNKKKQREVNRVSKVKNKIKYFLLNKNIFKKRNILL